MPEGFATGSLSNFQGRLKRAAKHSADWHPSRTIVGKLVNMIDKGRNHRQNRKSGS